jgi:DNA polymerase elongation subunit (family B)
MQKLNEVLEDEQKHYGICIDFETTTDIKKRPVFGVLHLICNATGEKKRFFLKSKLLDYEPKDYDGIIVIEETNPIQFFLSLTNGKTARIIGHNLAFDLERWLAFSDVSKDNKEIVEEGSFSIQLDEAYTFSRWVNANSERNDKFYLLKKGKRIIFEFLCTVQIADSLSFGNKTLKGLCKELNLQEQKKEYEGFEINNSIIDGKKVNLKQLDEEISYCEQDVISTYDLFLKLEEMIQEILRLISEIIGDFGISYYRIQNKGYFYQYLSRSTAKFSDVYLCSMVGDYKRLLRVKDKHSSFKPNVNTLGGRTRAYKVGISENVSVYDFESLYPSVMRTFGFSLLLKEPERISISYSKDEFKEILRNFCYRLIDCALSDLLKYRKSTKGNSFEGLIRKAVDYLQFDDTFIFPNSNMVVDCKDYLFTEGVISEVKKKDKSLLNVKGVRKSNILPMNQYSCSDELYFDIFKNRKQSSFKLFEGYMKGKGVPFNIFSFAVGVLDDVLNNFPQNTTDISSLKKDYREKYFACIDSLDILYCELFKANLSVSERKYDVVYDLLKYKRQYSEQGELTKSKATKIIMNSVYGKSANESFMLHNPILSSCVTTISRFAHRTVEMLSRLQGLSVIYADTDSIFIQGNDNLDYTPVINAGQGFSLLRQEYTCSRLIVFNKKRYIYFDSEGNIKLKLAGLKKPERELYLRLAEKMRENKSVDVADFVSGLSDEFIFSVMKRSLNVSKAYRKKGFYRNIVEAVKKGSYKNDKTEYVCIEGKHNFSLNSVWFDYLSLKEKCYVFSIRREQYLKEKILNADDYQYLRDKLLYKLSQDIDCLSMSKQYKEGYFYVRNELQYCYYDKKNYKENFKSIDTSQLYQDIYKKFGFSGIDKVKARGFLIFDNYGNEGVIRHFRSILLVSFKEYLIAKIGKKGLNDVPENSKVFRSIKEGKIQHLQLPFIVCDDYVKEKGILQEEGKSIEVSGYKIGEYEGKHILIVSSLHRKTVPHGFVNIGYINILNNNTLPMKVEYTPNRFSKVFNLTGSFSFDDIREFNHCLIGGISAEFSNSVQVSSFRIKEPVLVKILEWVYNDKPRLFQGLKEKYKIPESSSYKALIHNLIRAVHRDKDYSVFLNYLNLEKESLEVKYVVNEPYEVHLNKEIIRGSNEYQQLKGYIEEYKRLLCDGIIEALDDEFLSELEIRKSILFNVRDDNIYLRDKKNKIGIVLYSKKDIVIKDLLKVSDANKGKIPLSVLDYYRFQYEQGKKYSDVYRFELQLSKTSDVDNLMSLYHKVERDKKCKRK